ncbi:CASP-like protein 2D1 [Ananas comosus]|uniref:CASP-like protein n=1 Tax=Ananas comosus TaxID=4615 RepID=A0A199UHG8_ANACO|nr:CASP-like protein 2D1 [Ananas comosus]OAY64183.1 CASP-like protein 2D1 [Ananas comosus]OAY77003.1 CASP-like protein 2D1 [Ananas comosus]
MKEEANEPFKFVEMALRICVVPLTVASILVMATNKQESDTYGKVEYNNLTGFKYLVCISAISAGYALASTLSSFLRFFCKEWVLFLLDQVVAYLMVTSGSAVAEVVYLAEEGDREASWSEVCSYYGKFCYKTKVSLALHFMALVGFIALSLISAYRLFSKFDAPAVASTEVGEEGK